GVALADHGMVAAVSYLGGFAGLALLTQVRYENVLFLVPLPWRYVRVAIRLRFGGSPCRSVWRSHSRWSMRARPLHRRSRSGTLRRSGVTSPSRGISFSTLSLRYRYSSPGPSRSGYATAGVPACW